MKSDSLSSVSDPILYRALEQSMLGVVLINEKNQVMFFNPAAEKLWGYSAKEVIGKDVTLLVPYTLKNRHPEFIRHNREGGASRVEGMSRELQLECKNGKKIWTRFALSRVNVAGCIHYLAIVRDVSVEMERQEQKRLLVLAVDHIDRPVIVLDPTRLIVQFNRAFTEMFGHDVSDAWGKTPDSLLSFPEHTTGNRAKLKRLLWSSSAEQGEFMVISGKGVPLWIKASVSPVYDESAQLQNLVMSFSDITEDRQIRELERKALTAMCSSCTFHETGDIICQGIREILPDTDVSLHYLSNHKLRLWASSLTEHTYDTKGVVHSLAIRQKDGSTAGTLIIRTHTEKSATALIDRVADISIHLCALAIDQENNRLRIEQLIQFDPLTGLPNRNNLHTYIDELILSGNPQEYAVFVISIDHFQDVIDTLGYTAADQAILLIVNRLKEKLTPEQFLSRTEARQFVLVSPESDVAGITLCADELKNCSAEPLIIDGHEFRLTFSTGISYGTKGDRDYQLTTAHSAMEFIRKSGGNGWRFFDPAMNQVVKERLLMGAALKRAIAEGGLRLDYQPQIYTDTGKLYGLEALARWHDPEYGEVPPSRFIPLAEETGEIDNLGNWVISEACRQLSEWLKFPLDIPTLSINISALHFRHQHIPSLVAEAIDKYGIPGNKLTMELTESAMMDLDDEMLSRLADVRRLGVGLSIDDFGTGFSGLSRLASLPATEIKIDKSFIDRCLTESRQRALLEAITSIGRNLDLTVVAEGVETPGQLALLDSLQCPVIQGYYFSRPLNASVLPEWMVSTLPALQRRT